MMMRSEVGPDEWEKLVSPLLHMSYRTGGETKSCTTEGPKKETAKRLAAECDKQQQQQQQQQ